MFGNLTTRPQKGWLESLILDINSGRAFQSDRIECIRVAKKKSGIKFPRLRKLKPASKIGVAEIIEQKKKIDMLLLTASISEIIADLYKRASFNKLGLDFNNGSIFLWVEIKDEDDKNDSIIKEVISEANLKYSASGLKVHYIIVEEFLGLEIPPDYKEIKK